jgi:hypothetical protein
MMNISEQSKPQARTHSTPPPEEGILPKGIVEFVFFQKYLSKI